MRQIGIIGVPMDLGASRRGTDMGPSAIRYARLQEELVAAGLAVVDRGNVDVAVAEQSSDGSPAARYRDTIVRVCEEIDRLVAPLLDAGLTPAVLGGDHSLSLGTLAAVARRFPDAGVLWIDAHGDFNTPETSPTGNVHGMALAAAVGLGDPRLTGIGGFAPKVRAERVALVAVRDLDAGERAALRDAGVAVFTMTEIDRQGMAAVIREALAVATAGGRAPVHLSLDLDAVDPLFAPGVGTPVQGGLSYREAHLAMEVVSESGALASLEAVEVNPILDEQNRTGRLAVELIASALGKRIF